MQAKITDHFARGNKKPRHLVTFVRYLNGPFAKNAEAFKKHAIGKATDWCKKHAESYFIVQEFHEDGDPHIHALVYTKGFTEKATKNKYCRINIKELDPVHELPPPEIKELVACECKNCIFNSHIERDIIGAHPVRRKRCLTKIKIPDKPTNDTAFYLAKTFAVVTPVRYQHYNCSCKLC